MSGSMSSQYTTTLGDGQIWIGNGANPGPTAATLTPGTGISITNGAGSITINSTATGIAWQTLTSGGAVMSPSNGYVVSSSSSIAPMLLPLTASIGDTYYIIDVGAFGFTVSGNGTPVVIYCGDATPNPTGNTLTFTSTVASVTIVCKSASGTPTFQVLNFTGTFTLT